MKIEIVCVGRLKEKYWQDAAHEYLKRLSRYAPVEVVELPDMPVPENLSPAQRTAVIQAESQRELTRLKPGMTGVALDGRGKSMDSVAFSRYLQGLMREGRDVAFFIGGSLGHSEELLRSCRDSLSMGQMTWPHQLARVMLLEQIYRGFRIMRNEPYHK